MRLTVAIVYREGWDYGFYGGIYILKNDLVNGKNYWISKNGRRAVWWLDTVWCISSIFEVDTTNDIKQLFNKCQIFGPENDDEWPSNIIKDWRYNGYGNFLQMF